MNRRPAGTRQQLLRRFRDAFGFSTTPEYVSDVTFGSASDARGIEALFPGATVMWDANPRLAEWVSHYLRIELWKTEERFRLRALRLCSDSQLVDVHRSVIRVGDDRRPVTVRRCARAEWVAGEGDEPGRWVVIR